MTPERWQRINEVLEAVDSAPQSGRADILDRLCEGDPDLRSEVESYLVETGEGTFLHGVIGEQAASFSQPEARQERFGRYKLVRRIAQGGMGAVFEAVRVDDFHKKVALKIIKQGLDSDFARTRFVQERQTLASLEHPYIARLLDGGETDDGSPYLVLEFVDGEPITDYCAKLDRTARLRLFLKVCEAVEHAHRNLVVHRDLKPANILVTAVGEPKLLDFGIAKLLDSGSSNAQTGFAALTPDYASPEQVRGEPITTASDVYSLGVILYQMLTGRKPYTLETATALEMDRVICVQPPAAPGLGDEIDHILMMALRKEPVRRYGGVQKFAEDIERYLDHRPVSARPDTIGYVAKKFVRRHWTAVAAAVALLFTIAGGVAATLHQARLANQRFEQVRKLAHSFVFDYHDQLAKVEGTTAVREQMVTTALQYLDNLAQGAGSDLDLQKELAAAYQKVGDDQGSPSAPSLGHADQAIVSYRKAAEIHDRISLREPMHRREAGGFYISFANMLRLTRDYAGAARLAELARTNLELAARERPDDTAIQLELARSWCLLGDLDEDVDLTTPAYEKNMRCDAIARGVLERTPGIEALKVADAAKQRVGTTARAIGRLAEALAAFDQDELLLNSMLTMEPNNPSFRRAFALLAQFRSTAWYDDTSPSLGDPARGLEYARQYLEAARLMTVHDPNNASARFSHAIALFRLSFPLKYSDRAGAVRSARESVRIFDELIAGGRTSYLFVSRRGRALRRLSEALLFAGSAAAARAAAAEALAVQRKVAARDSKDLQEAALLAMMLVTSAEAADGVGDSAGAAGLLMEANQVSEAVRSRNPKELSSLIPLARVCVALGEHWRRNGGKEQTEHWYEEARRLWREFPDQSDFVRRQLAALKK